VGTGDDPEARERWYWEQRTYPAGRVPLAVHREVVRRELEATHALAGDEEAWTNLGPAPLLDITYGFDSVQNSSGRALALAIHPADPSTLLLGTAQGGIWKSTDRGATWRAVGELTLPALAVNVIRYSPADASVVYAGTGEPNGSTSIHGSGLLKSSDGGETWVPLPSRGEGWNFEYTAITGLQFDARDSAVIYVTTATITTPTAFFQAPPDQPHSGFFKSVDGGNSWSLLRAAQRYPVIGSLSAGFMDLEYGGALAPDLLFISEYFGGILKSEDGGASWRYVTPRKSNGLGAFPADVPHISYLERRELRYKLLQRLPNPGGDRDFRRPEIALSPGNPQILYAGYDAPQLRLDYDGNGIFESGKDRLYTTSLLFKSVDGGESWNWLGTVHDGIPDYCGAQCFYDNAIAVSPNDPNDVWIGGFAYYTGYVPDPGGEPQRIFETPWRGMIYRSQDGGRSWVDTTPHCTRYSRSPVRIEKGLPVFACVEKDPSRVIHPDTHAIVLGTNGTVYVANDGGLYRTSVATPPPPPPAASRRRAVAKELLPPVLSGVHYRWENVNGNLSTLQFYRIGSHPTDPDILLGGMQDNSAGRWDGKEWHGWGGGDGTIAIFDPRDPRHVYLGTQFSVHRHDNGGTKDFSPGSGWLYDVFAGLEFINDTETTSFVPVFVLDPVEPSITYGASNEGIYRSVSRGEASARLVPDEKTDGTPTWISVSPVDHNLVWVGTSTGTVYRYNVEKPFTGTATMTRVDSGLPNRFVSRVMASPIATGTVYALFNGYDANTPGTPGKLFVSTDFGTTWQNISGNLPDVPAAAMALDPIDPNRIWVASDAAVYSTADHGLTWQSERRNMPVVAVQDLDFNPRTGYLVAATHGRGVWRLRVRAAQVSQ
jgi:photosystem II stability/assembly factor-like uncharacterized protein